MAHTLAQARALRLGPCAVALGTFDGVHRGHAALLGQCLATARAGGLRAVAVTFDPHPAKLLRPQAAPPSIEPLRRRLAHFADLGLDAAVVLPFDAALAATPAADFVDHVLGDALGARHVVVGYDFAYGHRQAGDVAALRAHGAAGAGAGAAKAPFVTHVLAAVQDGAQVASSSAIRALVAAGDVAAAGHMLGRFFCVEGPVVHGDARGRTLGFPTANVAPEAELVPAYGVYAAWADAPQGRFAAAVSVGVHPTFAAAKATKVEAFLLDYAGEALYGAPLRLHFVARLRGEQTFAHVADLVQQMHADCAQVRHCLGLTHEHRYP